MYWYAITQLERIYGICGSFALLFITWYTPILNLGCFLFKVYIQHIDTDPNWLEEEGNADFDYRARIQKVEGDPEVEINDPEGESSASYLFQEEATAFDLCTSW